MMKRRCKGLALTAILTVNVLAGCAQPAADLTSQDGQIQETAETQANETSQGAAAFIPGTYSGTSIGRNGEMTVSVTVSEDKIEKVEITAHNETPGVADAALENIPKDIVENQSLAVDTYTGATITCNAIKNAAKAALEATGADLTAWNEPVSRRDISTETKDMTADLIVVGAGAAGMATAVSAAQNGAESVIVVETLSTIGGNAIVSGGYLEYMGAPEEILPLNNPGYDKEIEELLAMDFSDNEQMQEWQETVRQQYAEYQESGSPYVFDSNELLAMQYHVLQLGRPDDTLIGYAQKSHDVCEWFGDMFDEMGAEWGPCQVIIGFPWPRWSMVEGAVGGTGYFDALTETIERENLPVEILLETRAEELICTDDTVTGVVAKSVDGTTYNLTGTTGVVLATGGFASNGEMLVEYNTQWDNLTADIPTDNRSGTDGHGIEMAQAVGAGTAIMDQYMLFPLGSPLDGSLSMGIDGNFAMYVNQEGKRFVDETASRNEISQAIFNQTDGICYIIGDANTSGITDGKTAGGEDLEFLKQIGAVYEADTIEELAQQIGMDPETLRASVDAYNDAVTNFSDPEFGRVAFNEGSQIVTAPFYACPRTPTVHIILGGLTCSANAEVISTQGEPIPGLYAVGEVTAGGAALSSFADGMALGQYLFE